MSSLVRGAADVGRALSFVRHHRRTWSLLVAPALVTVALLVAIVAGVVWLSHPLVAWLGAHLPSWLEGVGMDVLSVVEVAGLVVAAALAYLSVVGAVAGPFNIAASSTARIRIGPPHASHAKRRLRTHVS